MATLNDVLGSFMLPNFLILRIFGAPPPPKKKVEIRIWNIFAFIKEAKMQKTMIEIRNWSPYSLEWTTSIPAVSILKIPIIWAIDCLVSNENPR